VERESEQWVLRTPAYVDELQTGLEELDGWPESVQAMQRDLGWLAVDEPAARLFTQGLILRQGRKIGFLGPRSETDATPRGSSSS